MRLVSKRYFGSHTQALQAARIAAAQAERGSDLHGCLFEAHVDVWRTMREMEGDGADAYLTSSWVRYELDSALESWLGGDYRARLGSGPALGAAAAWYLHAGDSDRLARVRTIIAQRSERSEPKESVSSSRRAATARARC
jgi:hypothetical protein